MQPVVTGVSILVAKDIMDMVTMNGSAVATLEMSDGTHREFSWYHDEITYVRADFVGQTMEQIRAMHLERDRKYLRS